MFKPQQRHRRKKNNPNELFVGNLSYFCEEQHLYDLFSHAIADSHAQELSSISPLDRDAFNAVSAVRIIYSDGQPHRSLMFGFVAFNNIADAHIAVQLLHGKMYMGRRLKVQFGNSPGSKMMQDDAEKNGFQVHVGFKSQFPMNEIVLPTEDFLREVFEPLGDLLDVAVKEYTTAQLPSRQEGYAFATFASEHSAATAIEHYRGVWKDGIEIDCSLSHRNSHLKKMEQMSTAPSRFLSQEPPAFAFRGSSGVSGVSGGNPYEYSGSGSDGGGERGGFAESFSLSSQPRGATLGPFGSSYGGASSAGLHGHVQHHHHHGMAMHGAPRDALPATAFSSAGGMEIIPPSAPWERDRESDAAEHALSLLHGGGLANKHHLALNSAHSAHQHLLLQQQQLLRAGGAAAMGERAGYGHAAFSPANPAALSSSALPLSFAPKMEIMFSGNGSANSNYNNSINSNHHHALQRHSSSAADSSSLELSPRVADGSGSGGNSARTATTSASSMSMRSSSWPYESLHSAAASSLAPSSDLLGFHSRSSFHASPSPLSMSLSQHNAHSYQYPSPAPAISSSSNLAAVEFSRRGFNALAPGDAATAAAACSSSSAAFPATGFPSYSHAAFDPHRLDRQDRDYQHYAFSSSSLAQQQQPLQPSLLSQSLYENNCDDVLVRDN